MEMSSRVKLETTTVENEDEFLEYMMIMKK